MHPSEELLPQAEDSFFNLLTGMCQGAVVLDKNSVIIWISEGYCSLLKQTKDDLLGKQIQEVVPTTQLDRVIQTGKPNLVDLMQINEVWCAVTRLPLRDGNGNITGAVGFIYYDELERLQPMFDKFSLLRRKYETQVLDRTTRYSFDDMIGQSLPLNTLKKQAIKAAQIDTTILLQGETGTGKELLAQGIHNLSPRKSGPFVGVNMGALPEALVESELFGAAPGAYTGADKKGRVGKIKLADGGTLFLDEIAEMPLNMQAKLLRVLQEREVEALGSNKLEKVDIRVIAATAVNLEEVVRQGKFRADLYYRLNVIELKIPPLRERTEDIPELAEHLLKQVLSESNIPEIRLSESAIFWLCNYAWPGNIRELRNRIERGCIMAEGEYIEDYDLHDVSGGAPAPTEATSDIKKARIRSELATIRKAIEECQGNKTRAAKKLGISRSSLYEKLKEADR